MATPLTVQTVSLGLSGSTYSGLQPTYAAADETLGNEFANTGLEFLHVKNGGAGSHTITIARSGKVCSQGHQHDVAIAIPAGEERMIGAFTKDEFNDAGALVQITWSVGATADVTLAALKLKLDG